MRWNEIFLSDVTGLLSINREAWSSDTVLDNPRCLINFLSLRLSGHIHRINPPFWKFLKYWIGRTGLGLWSWLISETQIRSNSRLQATINRLETISAAYLSIIYLFIVVGSAYLSQCLRILFAFLLFPSPQIRKPRLATHPFRSYACENSITSGLPVKTASPKFLTLAWDWTTVCCPLQVLVILAK